MRLLLMLVKMIYMFFQKNKKDLKKYHKVPKK